MSKKQAIILFFSAILIGFMAIMPFNYICKMTDRCQPIILSYYMPNKVGTQRYDLIFEAKDTSNEVDFQSEIRLAVLFSGEKFETTYIAKNLTEQDLKIRPKQYVYPPEAQKYIKFYECLCLKEHKVKKGSEKELLVKFMLKPEIDNDPFFVNNRVIRIGYELGQ